jgi:hypothetical protein
VVVVGVGLCDDGTVFTLLMVSESLDRKWKRKGGTLLPSASVPAVRCVSRWPVLVAS